MNHTVAAAILVHTARAQPQRPKPRPKFRGSVAAQLKRMRAAAKRRG